MAPTPPCCVLVRERAPPPACVCFFLRGWECRGLTQEANTVYISIMNQVAERGRKMRKGEKERGGRGGVGMEEWMEKAISPLLFLPSRQATPVLSIPSIRLSPFCHPDFSFSYPFFLASLDQIVTVLTNGIKTSRPICLYPRTCNINLPSKNKKLNH